MPRRPLPRSNRTAADPWPWFKCDRELTLRIAIDAHAVGTGLGGNESYATNLIEALAAIDSVNEYTLYVTRLEAVRKFRSAGPTSSFVRLVRIPLIRIPLTLSAELEKNPVDVLHVQFTAPPFAPCPVVVSIHDLSLNIFPKRSSAAAAPNCG